MRRYRFTAAMLMHGAAAVVLLAVAAVVAWGWATLSAQPAPPRLVPLTTFPGYELQPAFSPDGKQVAFAWDGEGEDNLDIYVKLVGETNALRLTTDPAPEAWPAWSPDGKRIAFRRSQPGAPGVWLVSPLGGAVERLTDLGTTGQMSWSPDGKWLAVAISPSGVKAARGIVLAPVDGGEPRWISRRPAPALDAYPSFSPDGRLLAYATCTSGLYACDVFVQELGPGYSAGGVPRRITEQGLMISGLAWTRDGEDLVYAGSWDWGFDSRLWRVRSRGGQEPEQLDLGGSEVRGLSVAPAGDRLAFARTTVDYDIWRYQLGGVPEPFLRSSRIDAAAQFSPDGGRIAFVSGRSGDEIDLWTVGADGARPIQLTRGPRWGKGSPNWSPDGRRIAYDSLGEDGRTKIFVVEANGGRPRRVSSETDNDSNPSWSRDGKRLYFWSNRTGRNEVWRASPDGGTAEQVTENGGLENCESRDGTTLYYTKSLASPLFARSLDGGPERQVLDLVSWNAFVVFEDGIYYIGRLGADRQYPIQFHEFSSGASRLFAKVEGPLQQHLSVSPDRRTLLFTKSATRGSDLMLLENFR